MKNSDKAAGGLLFFLFGFMGSGKSYVAKNITKRMNLEYIDLDHLIERTCESKIATIFRERGESGFREIESRILKEIINSNNPKIIALGGGAPCYSENLKWIKKNGISIYIKKDVSSLLKNLQHGIYNRPLLANLSSSELKEFIFNKLQEREFYYRQADYIIYEKHSTELIEAIELIINHELKLARGLDQ